MNMLNEDLIKEMMAERERILNERHLRSAAHRRTKRARTRSSASGPSRPSWVVLCSVFSRSIFVLAMVVGVVAGVVNLVHQAPAYVPNVGPSWLMLTGATVTIITLIVAPPIRIRFVGLLAATLLLLPAGGVLLIVHGLSIFGLVSAPVDPVSLAISAAAASCLIAMWTTSKRAGLSRGRREHGGP